MTKELLLKLADQFEEDAKTEEIGFIQFLDPYKRVITVSRYELPLLVDDLRFRARMMND